jgi:hypothetical protein
MHGSEYRAKGGGSVGSAGTFDERDLLSMDPPALQRALLKVPDNLIAQALGGAPAAVAARIVGNLSARRASAVGALSRRLLDSGELGPSAAQAAVRNLVRKVFEVAGPEADGREASRSVGPAPSAATREEGEPKRPPGPDLTPPAFARLRETRAILDAARRVSPFVQEFERTKLGANAGVLARTWLRSRFS